jgi:hypothetical protein
VNVNAPAVCDVEIGSFLYSICSLWSEEPWECLSRMASADGVHKYEIRACYSDTEEDMFLGI